MRAFQLVQPQRKHKIAINFIAAKKKIFFCGECLFSERMLNVSCVVVSSGRRLYRVQGSHKQFG